MRSILNHGLLPILLTVAAATAALAQPTIYAWNAAAPADWNVTDNWDGPAGNFIPNSDEFAGESALISNGSTAIANAKVPTIAGLEVRNGKVDILDGGIVQITADDENTGGLMIGGAGAISLDGDGQLTVAGDTSNAGTLQVSGAQAAVNFAGDFRTTGTLIAAINGDSHSAIMVGGSASLGGTLQVDLAGVEPTFGQSWDLINAGSVAGNFSSVSTGIAPPLARGLQYQVSSDADSAALRVGNALVLTINRQTGAGSIANVVGDTIELTGYALRSDSGLLSPDTWASEGLGEGWQIANPTANHLAELNVTGARGLDAGASFNLGAPYLGGPIGPADEDLFFEYTTADGRLDRGIVEYTGALNDIVLHVDPTDGSAAIANLSQFIEAPELTGYAVRSQAGSLVSDGLTGFANFGNGSGTWRAANPSAEHLAELNIEGSLAMTNGTLVPLGSVFTLGAEQDLLFEYTTASGELRRGTVQYGAIPEAGAGGPVGDCNGDGQLTAADLTCVSDLGSRDAVLGAIGALAGDLDGDGEVGFADFLVLSANFGQDGLGYSQGNIDLESTVGFSDFLILSTNFGQTAAGAAVAVPEPSAFAVCGLGLLMLGQLRSRRL